MLVHICCSVDSHYFLKRLREELPDTPLIGFFYNPNIHPYEEYELRLNDVKRSCKMYEIRLLEGEYDDKAWFEKVKGLECEPERGERCEVCFEKRLQMSAKKAKELGEREITTTLFMSPKKSFEQLKNASEKISREFGVEVKCFDFRKNGGTQEQFKLSRSAQLYHQNYCGCMFALSDQRVAQKRPTDELMCPIGKDILSGSVNERNELYKKVAQLENMDKYYQIAREKFLNYRLLWGRVSARGEAVPSYFLSKIDGEFEIKTESIKNGFGFTACHALLLDISAFNRLSSAEYKSVKELIFAPPSQDELQKLQEQLGEYSPLIVLENIEKTTYKIEAKSVLYQDVREVLAIL